MNRSVPGESFPGNIGGGAKDAMNRSLPDACLCSFVNCMISSGVYFACDFMHLTLGELCGSVRLNRRVFVENGYLCPDGSLDSGGRRDSHS